MIPLSEKRDEYFKEVMNEFGTTPEIKGLIIGIQTVIYNLDLEAVKKLKTMMNGIPPDVLDSDSYVSIIQQIDEIFGSFDDVIKLANGSEIHNIKSDDPVRGFDSRLPDLDDDGITTPNADYQNHCKHKIILGYCAKCFSDSSDNTGCVNPCKCKCHSLSEKTKTWGICWKCVENHKGEVKE